MADCANMKCKRKNKKIPEGKQVAFWIETSVFFLCPKCANKAIKDNSIRVCNNGEDTYDYTLRDLK